MYLVVKTCVYDHGVMFITLDLEEAKEMADIYAGYYDDGHHAYEVREFKQAEPAAKGAGYDMWEDMCETIYVGGEDK